MDLALSIARSGLEAHHENIEVISNNLANANTTAFKRNRAEFEDLPYQVIREAGAPDTQSITPPGGLSFGTGVKLAHNEKIFENGPQIGTGDPNNIFISGQGFLEVQDPTTGNTFYTRAGQLEVNYQGQLTLPNGYLVQPQITLPQGTTSMTIGKDGTVTVTTNNSTTPQQIGQLQLTTFINQNGLQPQGGNLYAATFSSGTGTQNIPGQNGTGVIIQNALEGSNVNVVEEMVNLIEAQRSFEVTSKAVSAVDSMMQTITRDA